MGLTKMNDGDILGVHREVFLDFDPIAVSKLNEKKILTPGSALISEVKLRATIENARQTNKVGAICRLSFSRCVFLSSKWSIPCHCC